jgi:hypothetical protein
LIHGQDAGSSAALLERLAKFPDMVFESAGLESTLEDLDERRALLDRQADGRANGTGDDENRGDVLQVTSNVSGF